MTTKTFTEQRVPRVPGTSPKSLRRRVKLPKTCFTVPFGLGLETRLTYFYKLMTRRISVPTGHYFEHRIATMNGESRISAEDYAIALLDEVEQPQYVRRQMTVAY